MKKRDGLLLAALLSIAGAAAGENVSDSPQDYAWGAALVLPQTASWYRVDLPQEVYARTAWPDLRDVRVFNGDGERVPLTFEAESSATAMPASVPLRVFPLDASPVANTMPGEQVVHLHSAAGMDIRIEGEVAKLVGQSYLLVLPDTMPETFTLAQLKLTWPELAENWRGNVTIFFSSDMRSWNPLQENVPVMALNSGGDRLTIDQIDIRETFSSDGARYLLMVFDTPQLPITLTQVTAMLGNEPSPPKQIPMVSSGRRISATEAQYQWPQPQPFSSVSVSLAEDGVLPVGISWRSRADAPWQSLGKAVLWQRNGQASAPLSLPGAAIQAVRITTLDARLPDSLPKVTGSRDRLSVIFNAQGKGPFLLAWGNKAATPAAVTLDGLIPQALRKQLDLSALPQAQPQARITLGGEARLTATSPAERQAMWQTLLVWGALLVGVAALLWMALRIWRETRAH